MSTIAPNDANIVYSPYTWLVTGTSAKTINSGAYLRMAFTGTPTVLTASFDVSNQPSAKSRVGFRIDGGSWQDFSVAASVALAMPSNNTWTAHTLEMVVIATTEGSERWTTQTTAVILTGITGDVTLTTTLTRASALHGIVFGDSITEGVRTLELENGADVNRNDTRLTWAYPIGAEIGAEIGVIGFGGTGISTAGSGGVPKFPDSAPYLWAGQARDLTVAPDFIVAHIGTNDSSQTDADVTADTAALLNGWIAATPVTTAIFVMAGWLQTKAAAILAGINACSAPARVTYVDTTGWWSTADSSDGLHPYGYVNLKDLSPRVAATIRPPESFGVTRTFIRAADGTAVPIETHIS